MKIFNFPIDKRVSTPLYDQFMEFGSCVEMLNNYHTINELITDLKKHSKLIYDHSLSYKQKSLDDILEDFYTEVFDVKEDALIIANDIKNQLKSLTPYEKETTEQSLTNEKDDFVDSFVTTVKDAFYYSYDERFALFEIACDIKNLPEPVQTDNSYSCVFLSDLNEQIDNIPSLEAQQEFNNAFNFMQKHQLVFNILNDDKKTLLSSIIKKIENDDFANLYNQNNEPDEKSEHGDNKANFSNFEKYKYKANPNSKVSSPTYLADMILIFTDKVMRACNETSIHKSPETVINISTLFNPNIYENSDRHENLGIATILKQEYQQMKKIWDKSDEFTRKEAISMINKREVICEKHIYNAQTITKKINSYAKEHFANFPTIREIMNTLPHTENLFSWATKTIELIDKPENLEINNNRFTKESVKIKNFTNKAKVLAFSCDYIRN